MLLTSTIKIDSQVQRSRHSLLEEFTKQVGSSPQSIILYGSFFIGTWRPGKSDIDLLYIYSAVPQLRRHERIFFQGTEIHVAHISLDILRDDALHMRYGFLYISKLLNPHTFLHGDIYRSKLCTLVATYLEQYCFPEIFADKRPLTIEEIIARIYLVHLNNFPHYVTKLLNTFIRRTFIHLKSQFTAYVEQSDLIAKIDGRYVLAIMPTSSYRPYYHEIVRLTWWQTYQDYRQEDKFLVTAIAKSRDSIQRKQHDVEQLIHFLHQEAHYETYNSTSA